MAANTSARRRQNISCDTCRRAKRRCKGQNSDSPSRSGEACSRCLRIGQPCTWHFVDAQDAGKRVTRLHACGSDESAPGIACSEESVDRMQLQVAQCARLPKLHLDQEPRVVGGTVSSSPHYKRKREDEDLAPALTKLGEITSESSEIARGRLEYSDYWTSHSTRTLNDGFSFTLFRQKQIQVQELTQNWCQDRYLVNNPLSSGDGHLGDLERFQTIAAETKSLANAGLDSHQAEVLTLSVAARLLDSFAGLYGNSLSPHDRRNAVRAEEAVSEAWCMQWLPLRDPDVRSSLVPSDALTTAHIADDLLDSQRAKDIYSTYWWRAQRLLTASKASASFTRILAVLTFNLAAVPDGALLSLLPGDGPLDLLDRSLLQLQALLQMVRDFSHRLPASSEYQTLLTCAAGLVHWYGYVRDTSTAMMFGRQTVLYDVCIPRTAAVDQNLHSASAAATEQHLLPVANADQASHQLSSSIIALWRLTVRLKDIRKTGRIDLVDYKSLVRDCCDLIDLCNDNEVQVSESALRGGGLNGSVSSASPVHVLLSWNYGVLKLVQYCREFEELVHDSNTLIRLDAFEVVIVRSIAMIAARFSFRKNTGASDIALVAQNSNLPLVSRILVAFVDHAVGLYATPPSIPAASRASSAVTSLIDRIYISNLLQSLSILQHTMQGSSIAHGALRNLMFRHSDPLMDIWLNSGQATTPP